VSEESALDGWTAFEIANGNDTETLEVELSVSPHD